MLREQIADEFLRLLYELEDQGRDELRAQGHVASGRGINSLEGAILENSGNRMVGVIYAEDYLVGPVDQGVKPGRIPFSGRTGRGGTSQFIQGLIDWSRYVKPSLSDDERLSFAFAVANKMKAEGTPTRGSYSFSQNGRRKDWIENGFAVNADELERRLRLFALLEGYFGRSLQKAAA